MSSLARRANKSSHRKATRPSRQWGCLPGVRLLDYDPLSRLDAVLHDCLFSRGEEDLQAVGGRGILAETEVSLQRRTAAIARARLDVPEAGEAGFVALDR